MHTDWHRLRPSVEAACPWVAPCPKWLCPTVRRTPKMRAEEREQLVATFAFGLLPRTSAAGHLRIGGQVNLTPTDRPFRQTTRQFRPVLVSRAKASRSVAGSRSASSLRVILAPELETSSTVHCRAANPPSSVIQAGLDINLRAARFFRMRGISTTSPALPLSQSPLRNP